MTQKSPSVHHRATLSGCIFATKAFIDSRKKTVKQQYVLHMTSQYGELRPTNGGDRFGSLGYPSKFQLASRLAFVTAATSLIGGQPNFARCLAVSWPGTLDIDFRGLLPLTVFCPVQNSLYVQVLRSPILAALLHGTPTAGVSRTLGRRAENGITDFRKGRHLHSTGGPSRWALAHILVSIKVDQEVAWALSNGNIADDLE